MVVGGSRVMRSAHRDSFKLARDCGKWPGDFKSVAEVCLTALSLDFRSSQPFFYVPLAAAYGHGSSSNPWQMSGPSNLTFLEPHIILYHFGSSSCYGYAWTTEQPCATLSQGSQNEKWEARTLRGELKEPAEAFRRNGFRNVGNGFGHVFRQMG